MDALCMPGDSSNVGKGVKRYLSMLKLKVRCRERGVGDKHERIGAPKHLPEVRLGVFPPFWGSTG